MAYTVNKLAKLSGVSVRTLHYYDEIGLLEPAYQGDNKYRYYEEPQLLRLQQILFYRELGVPLNDIGRVLSSKDFEMVEALQSHRIQIERELNDKGQLLKTIDKTIARLRGNIDMKDSELFYGFDSEKQKMYEEHLVEQGIVSEDEMASFRKAAANMSKEDQEKYILEGNELNKAFVVAIEKELKPNSLEVQALVARHYKMISQFWTPTKETYIGLTQMYSVHPEFIKFFSGYHPQLAEFLIESMKVYSENEL